MGLLNESLQQVCLSIERLEPFEESLNKLLWLTTAAYQLIADEESENTQLKVSKERFLALDKINHILEQKLYLDSKQEQLQKFAYVKHLILSNLHKLHN